MFKKILVTSLIVTAFALPSSAYAETTCTQSYGQPVVCGVNNEEHFPVKTGIADLSLNLLGFGSIGLSSIFYILSKRKSKAL